MEDSQYVNVSQISATESCKTLLVQDKDTGEYLLKALYTSWPVPNARLTNCMNAYLQLKSPYLVRLREFFVDTSFTLITDMISGQTLRSIITKRRITQRFFTTAELWRITIQILEGVKAYHDFYEKIGAEADVPPNLFLAPAFIIVSDEQQLTLHITEFYQTLLLPSIQRLYAASGAAPPEVAKHLPITAAADIWMVGSVLYELLTLQQLDVERLEELSGNVVTLEEMENLYPIDYKPLAEYQSKAVCQIMDPTKAFRYRELYALLSCMLIIVPGKRPPIGDLLTYALMHAPAPTSPSSVAQATGQGDDTGATDGTKPQNVEVGTQSTATIAQKESVFHNMPLSGVKTDLHRAVEEQSLDKVLLNMHFVRSTDLDGNTALVYAIRANNEEMVKALAPEEVSVLTGEGFSPLHLALLLDRPHLAKYLDASYDLQFLHSMELCVDEHGITNLMRCVCEQNLVGVYHYSERQQKYQDYEGRTALIKAVLNYNEGLPAGQGDVNLAIIKILRRYESRMKDKRGRTALMYAADCGYLAAIDALSCAEAGMRGDDGQNALEIAFGSRNIEAAEKLLLVEPVAHSCPDRQGLTDLMKACIEGDPFALFCHMSQTRATDINGNTALMHCVIHDRPEFIPKLSDEYRMINRISGYSALILAVQLEKHACFEALVKHEATLKSLDGMTALMMIASRGLKLYVCSLINIETNIMNGTWNAMTYAIAAEHHDIVSLLAPIELNLPAVLREYDALGDTAAEIERELRGSGSGSGLGSGTQALMLADSRLLAMSGSLSGSGTGFTPLMYAAQQANINAVWGLRDKYMRRQDKHGFTALIYATQAKSKECCKLLADERDIFCVQRLSAWFYSYKSGYYDVLDMIRPTIKYTNRERRLTDLHTLIKRNEGDESDSSEVDATGGSSLRASQSRDAADTQKKDTKGKGTIQTPLSARRRRRQAALMKAGRGQASTDTGSQALSRTPDYLRDVSTILYQSKLYTSSGKTALMIAAKSYCGTIDTNLLSLETGLRDSYGRMASHMAIESGNTKLLAQVLPFEREALIADGFTELMLAVINDDYGSIVRCLETTDQRGKVALSEFTALTIAIYCSKNTLIPLLAPYEAHIEILNKVRPLDLAYEARNTEAIMMLMPYSYTGGRLALSQCLCALIRTAIQNTGLTDDNTYSLLSAFHSSNYRMLKETLQNQKIQSMSAFKELADSFQDFMLNVEYLILPDAVFDEDGNSQLHIAALGSDARLATAFVHLHSLRNKHGETALMLAARSGSESIIEILLPYEAEAQDNFKMTATEHSIISGTFYKVQNLYQREKSFLVTECEFSPLMLAVLEGDSKTVTNSLKYAKLRTLSGMTALHMAIYLRHQSHVHLLKAEKGIMTYDGLSTWFLAKEKRIAYDILEAEPTIDAMGCTELHRAAIQNNIQQIRNFIPMAKKYNANGRTALMEACLAGSLDAAKILVNYEHGMRAKNRFTVDNSYFDEATALMLAAASGHDELVRLLISYESKMHEACNGKTALMAAAAAGRCSTLELLIESEAGLTGQNGWTALMTVVSKQYVECVKPLLAKEAGMRDSQGNCALVIAIRNGNMDIVKLLAPIEAKIMGKSMLMRIWKSNTMYDEIIRYVNKIL